MGFNRRTNLLSLRDQPKLIKAILRNDVTLVKHLIDNEEEDVVIQEVNRTDIQRRTPLHLCSALGHTRVAELLIDAGARVNARDNDWLSPLHRACRNNHDLVVKLLLDRSADANFRDRQWITPMHVVAAHNGLECAKLLLPNINTIDASDRLGATPLHHAAFNSHLDMVSFLLANKAQANAFDKCDRRPIHYAAIADSTDAIRFLVENGGAEVNVRDKDLLTPLHMAAAKGSLNALQLLLDFGAKIDDIDAFGNTAVHWAALEGQDDILEELILRGAILSCVNHMGLTPLHLAASSPMGASTVDVLLTKKDSIDVNARDKFGRTALHLAAKYGRHNRISDLIRCGAKTSIADKQLATPLHYASCSAQTSVIDALLSISDTEVNPIDTYGMSALHYASMSGVSSACKRLLEADADSRICDTSGRTPHFLASYSGNSECLQMMMPLPDKLIDAFNRSLLHYASSAKSSECLDFLLKNFKEKFDINQRDISGLTALHCAASRYEDDNRCVDLLLEFGAKPDICDNNGFYALHYAAATGMTSALCSLLAAHDWKKVKMCVCPTHCAAFYGKQEALQKLLESGFNDIGPALEYAILKEHSSCVKTILDYLMNGSNMKFSTHIINQSVLVAAQFALHDTLNVLLNYVENIDMRDHLGRTPLMLAALNDSDSDCVELILKHKANPNATDSQKRSALFYAIYSGNEETVKALLYYGALPQSPCLNGKTPYHLAAALGRTDILIALLKAQNNFSPEALFDREGLTPLHWAAFKSHPECVSTLLDYDISKKVRGKVSALHLAALSSSIKCFDLLITHFGSQIVHSVDTKKRTALHFAALANSSDTKIIDLLISDGLNINCTDISGQTPLMYAAKRGNIRVLEYLMSLGADVRAVDDKQNTALHLSCINSQQECAIKILKQCSSLASATNDELKTPLHISAANGLVMLTQELLLLGASVTACDADGLTPSLCCAKNSEVCDCLMLIESIMVSEGESHKYNSDMESASSETRQSIIKRKSAQIFCDNNTSNVSLNNITDHQNNSSDSDFY